MSHPQSMHHGAPPSRGGDGVVIALVVAIVLVVGGFGAWWLVGRQSSQQTQPQPTSVDQTEHPSQQSESQPPSPEQSQSPSPSQEQPGSESEVPKQPSDQDTGESQQGAAPAPPLPKKFGQFRFEEEKESKGVSYMYRAEDGTSITVTYADYVTADQLKMGEGARPIRDWSCIKQQKEGQVESVACGGAAHEGVVVIGAAAVEYSLEDIATIADDLMAAWN